MTEPGKVHAKFAAAFASVGAIAKASKNKHHGYAYRGIDDVLNALHGVLADQGLFYVPRMVGEAYDEWQTSKGGRLQVARIAYEFIFYADDGSSLTVGPVIGQSADTDDKAPMQALSQAAKYALLQAFCVPTEDVVDADATSTVHEAGGRSGPSLSEQLAALDQVIVEAKAAGIEGDYDATRDWAAESVDNARTAAGRLRKAIAEKAGGS